MTKHDADNQVRETEPTLGITWIYDIRATLGSECALRHTRCIEMCRRIADGPTRPIDTGEARGRVRHQNWWAPLLISGVPIFSVHHAIFRLSIVLIVLGVRFFGLHFITILATFHPGGCPALGHCGDSLTPADLGLMFARF